jgi:hypothetical protein
MPGRNVRLMTSRFGKTFTRGPNSLLPRNSFFKEHRQRPKCYFGEHDENGLVNTLYLHRRLKL